MDLFLKDILGQILKFIFYWLVYILFSPIIFIMSIKKKFDNVKYFILNKNRWINSFKYRFIHGYKTSYRSSSRKTHHSFYYPKYKVNKSHLNYITRLINKNKNEEKYSKKKLYQFIYFSKFFGTLFYYLNIDYRLRIKYSFFRKKTIFNICSSCNLDSLDFLFILTKENIYSARDLKKLLLSLMEYSDYDKIGLSDFIENVLYSLLSSKLEEEDFLELIIIVFNHFKEKKDGFFADNKQYIDVYGLLSFSFSDFMDKFFYKIELKNEMAVYKTLEILQSMLNNDEKIKLLLSYINNDSLSNSISKINTKTIKLVLSLLILLNFDITEQVKVIKLKLTESDFNEVSNYFLFFKLTINLDKHYTKEKIKKI